MKNYKILLLGFSILLFVGCKKETEKPKVSYNKKSKTTEAVQTDTTKIEIADLPIQFEGTKYLIFPVGDLRVLDKNSKLSYGSSTVNETGYSISSNIEGEITGYLQNLKFQKVDSDSLVALTNKTILLQSATYLKSIADKTKQQILVYLLADADTNNDGKLDSNDIKSLYISDISGSRFTKISRDFEEVIDWKVIDSRNRLYFRTLEDTNKNGQFDKNDKVHYNFVNLSNKDWKVEEYSPM